MSHLTFPPGEKSNVVYLAVELPEYDGSGKTTVLGVFTNESAAYAVIGKRIIRQGYDSRCRVVPCTLNEVIEVDPDDCKPEEATTPSDSPSKEEEA